MFLRNLFYSSKSRIFNQTLKRSFSEKFKAANIIKNNKGKYLYK